MSLFLNLPKESMEFPGYLISCAISSFRSADRFLTRCDKQQINALARWQFRTVSAGIKFHIALDWAPMDMRKEEKGKGLSVWAWSAGTIHNCHIFIAEILRAWFYGRLIKWIFQHTTHRDNDRWRESGDADHLIGHLIESFDIRAGYLPFRPASLSFAHATAHFYYKRAPPAAQVCKFFLFVFTMLFSLFAFCCRCCCCVLRIALSFV